MRRASLRISCKLFLRGFSVLITDQINYRRFLLLVAHSSYFSKGIFFLPRFSFSVVNCGTLQLRFECFADGDIIFAQRFCVFVIFANSLGDVFVFVGTVQHAVHHYMLHLFVFLFYGNVHAATLVTIFRRLLRCFRCVFIYMSPLSSLLCIYELAICDSSQFFLFSTERCITCLLASVGFL